MALCEPDGEGLDRVVVVIHRGPGATAATLPEARDGFAWQVLADSADPAREGELDAATALVASRSVLILTEGRSPHRRQSAGIDPDVLLRLARSAGVATRWRDLDGAVH